MNRNEIKAISGIATVTHLSGAVVRLRPDEKAKVKEIAPVGTVLPFFRALHVLIDFDWYEVTLPSGENGWIHHSDADIAFTPETIPALPLADLQGAIVTIDAGHGGSAPGASNPDTGYPEKAANLDIALQLKQLLLSAGVGKVWMTREADQDVSLAYRADLGTASGGHLFISIHNNSSSSREAHGTETYFQCGTEQTFETKDKSHKLSLTIQANLLSAIDTSQCAASFDRGVKCRLNGKGEDYYYVLRNTFLPSVIAECVFLSNPAEAHCLEQAAFRTRLAEGLRNGIIIYLTTTT